MPRVIRLWTLFLALSLVTPCPRSSRAGGGGPDDHAARRLGVNVVPARGVP